MIYYTRKSIFDVDVDAIVNPVNTMGIMGAGLAEQFKNRFTPEDNAFMTYYETACRSKHFDYNRCLIYPIKNKQGKYVIHFATKNHFRNPSRMEYICKGLMDLSCLIDDWGITSIALPKLGCGLGGLSWADVEREIVEFANQRDDLDIVVCV